MQNLKVSVIQSDIIWNKPSQNIERFESKINVLDKDTRLIVLPEVFSTGFNMCPKDIYEKKDSVTLKWMQHIAETRQCYICGSLLFKENEYFYNRLFLFYPDGSCVHYNKKHLFTHAGEDKHFKAGEQRIIAPIDGINVLLTICYDLRFPVWLKNTYENGVFAYDMIVCVANWPAIRSNAWQILLQARAIENQAYVIAANRVGNDANNVPHSGNTIIIDPKGNILSEATPFMEETINSTIDLDFLNKFRKHFAVASNWDKFEFKK